MIVQHNATTRCNTKQFFVLAFVYGSENGVNDSDFTVVFLVQVVNEAEALAFSATNSENCNEDSRKDSDKILHRDQTRVSLTCRLVPKVHKNLFRF